MSNLKDDPAKFFKLTHFAITKTKKIICKDKNEKKMLNCIEQKCI